MVDKIFKIETSDFYHFKLVTSSAKNLITHCLNVSESSVINTLNPHSFVSAEENQEFALALEGSDYIIPDGVGVCIAHNLFSSIKLEKISGFDIFWAAMEAANSENLSVMFIGSTIDTLNRIKRRASKDFPFVQISILSPPFKAKFETHDLMSINESINSLTPDIVFFGLTAPKQEILIHQLKDKSQGKVLLGIGAVFDFYAGSIKRPSDFWVKLKLEWLIRLIFEPRRLWRRTFISGPKFIFYVVTKRVLKST